MAPHHAFLHALPACLSGTVILAKLGEAMNIAHPMLDLEYKSPDIKNWQRWRDVCFATFECASASARSFRSLTDLRVSTDVIMLALVFGGAVRMFEFWLYATSVLSVVKGLAAIWLWLPDPLRRSIDKAFMSIGRNLSVSTSHAPPQATASQAGDQQSNPCTSGSNVAAT